MPNAYIDKERSSLRSTHVALSPVALSRNVYIAHYSNPKYIYKNEWKKATNSNAKSYERFLVFALLRCNNVRVRHSSYATRATAVCKIQLALSFVRIKTQIIIIHVTRIDARKYFIVFTCFVLCVRENWSISLLSTVRIKPFGCVFCVWRVLSTNEYILDYISHFVVQFM